MSERKVSDPRTVNARTLKHGLDHRGTQIAGRDVLQASAEISNCGSGRTSDPHFTHDALLFRLIGQLREIFGTIGQA